MKLGSHFIKDDEDNPKALWKNIIAGERWFVSCEFRPLGKDSGTPIAERHCTPLPSGADLCDHVEIGADTINSLPAGTGTIVLKVNWVDRMRGGLSFGGTNLVYVCTRAWWDDISSADQNRIAIHEVGHRLGMVADGTCSAPDRVATHYTGKGHKGPHCHYGIPALDDYSDSSGDCVMFGAVSGHSDFCPECAPAVKKLDLSSGFE